MNRKKFYREKQPCLVVIRAWFSLTSSERMTLLVIAALVILGLAARYWHLSHEQAEMYPEPASRRQITDN